MHQFFENYTSIKISDKPNSREIWDMRNKVASCYDKILYLCSKFTQKIYTFDKLNQSIITSESKTETRLSKNFLLFVFIFFDNIFFVLSYWRYVNFPLRSRIKETRICWVRTSINICVTQCVTPLLNPQQYWRKEFVKLLKYFVWYKNREKP